MKIKPVISDNIKTKHTSFEVDFELENNITFICGESGVGKSAVFTFLKELSAEKKYMRCFNYLDPKESCGTSIRKSKGKLFVIDNADILLTDNLRKFIASDDKNQYVIIGRDPTGLMLSFDEVYELNSENINGVIRFTLTKSFE